MCAILPWVPWRKGIPPPVPFSPCSPASSLAVCPASPLPQGSLVLRCFPREQKLPAPCLCPDRANLQLPYEGTRSHGNLFLANGRDTQPAVFLEIAPSGSHADSWHLVAHMAPSAKLTPTEHPGYSGNDLSLSSVSLSVSLFPSLLPSVGTLTFLYQ